MYSRRAQARCCQPRRRTRRPFISCSIHRLTRWSSATAWRMDTAARTTSIFTSRVVAQQAQNMITRLVRSKLSASTANALSRWRVSRTSKNKLMMKWISSRNTRRMTNRAARQGVRRIKSHRSPRMTVGKARTARMTNRSGKPRSLCRLQSEIPSRISRRLMATWATEKINQKNYQCSVQSRRTIPIRSRRWKRSRNHCIV